MDERVKEIIRKAELQGNTALAESGKEVIGKFSADDVVAITLDGVLKADDRRLSLIYSSI